jgi:glutathione synthase/RimK-type ligase-like ATP-grasp enzyme
VSRTIVIVDRPADFPGPLQSGEVMTAREYLFDAGRASGNATRVINLCADQTYLGTGYYCSLLAEARRHSVIPSVEVMLELHWKRLLRIGLPQAGDLVQHSLKELSANAGDTLQFYVYFGTVDDPKLTQVGRRVFDLFRCPILSVELARRQDRWQMSGIHACTMSDLGPAQRDRLIQSLEQFTRRIWRRPRTTTPARYTIAMLHDPNEKLPPSDNEALKRFVRAGAKLGIEVEPITRTDYARLLEFDALLIRETTAIDHHTYRFAKKAEAEGMPVIDDSQSIMRCTNKIYLAELLKTNGIPAPKTLILDRNEIDRVAPELGFPVVLKVPDGSFSRGVFRVDDAAELNQTALRILKDSDLVVAQEYMATEFDWRIGVLAGKPLFACQYLMARGHWQIVQHTLDGAAIEGGWRTFAVSDVPPAVVDLATRAANLIGKGFYGVDLKATERGVFVVEINDNPSVEAGVEDFVIKDELYQAVLLELINRIERRAQPPSA